MSMNTPIGNITQTTPISSFHELTEMQLNQYLLGINNIVQGDGAKITLQNLIKGVVSTDENNLITLDSNGRLSVTAGAFNTDTGWAAAPTITVDWSAGTVMGVGGAFYLEGVLVAALSNFIATNMPTNVGKHYLYYNTQTEALEWSTGFPVVQNDFVHHICEIVILADGNKFAVQTWELGGTSENVIEYLNTTMGMVVLNGGQISNVVTDTPQQRYPVINQATIGLANFSQTFATTSTGSVYMQSRATAENVLACEGGQAEIVPVDTTTNAPMYNNNYTLTALESGKFMNVWLVGLPVAGATPYTTNYLYVIGDTQYDDLASATSAGFASDSSMLAIANQFERYCVMARFTLNYTGEDFSIIDYGRISQADIDKIITDLDNKADIDGSNMVSSVKNFDGQWIYSNLLIASSVTAPTATDLTYDLSDYLPNDNYNYELLMFYTAITDTTINSIIRLQLQSQIIESNAYLTYITTRTSSSQTAGGIFNFLVGTNRELYVTAYNANAGRFNLYAKAYRRLGTNS